MGSLVGSDGETVAGGPGTDGFSDIDALIGRTEKRRVEGLGLEGFFSNWNWV